MTPDVKVNLAKLAHGEPLSRAEFQALLKDPEGRKELTRHGLIRSLFQPEFGPSQLEDQITTHLDGPNDSETLSTDSVAATGPPAGSYAGLVAAEDWVHLGKRLQVYVPAILHVAGLPPELAEELLTFLVERARTAAALERPFGEVLLQWLEEFAQSQGLTTPQALTRQEWERALNSWSARRVLETATHGEPQWASEFRQLALDQCVSSGPELLRLPLPAPLQEIPALPTFRRDLLCQMEKERHDALSFFELD